MLTSMIFIGLITFWHAILSRFKDNPDLQSKMDFGVFIAFAVMYLIFQLMFIFVMLYQVIPYESLSKSSQCDLL